MTAISPIENRIFKTRKLFPLEGSRGIAALLVVLFHSGIPFFRFGHCGVEFFFVLSGFIVCYAHQADLGNQARLTNYLAKRAIRIYPLYWLILSILTLCLAFLPGLAATPGKSSPLVIVRSFLLIPMRQTPVLGLAWTLEHEMLFYVVFALVILRRHFIWIIFLWGGCCLLFNYPEPDLGSRSGIIYPEFPASFLFSLRNLGFALGVAAARHFATGRTLPRPGLWLIAGNVLFWGNGLLELYLRVPLKLGILAYLLGAVLVVRALVELDRTEVMSVSRPVLILGAASYAIYLIHFPVITAVQKMLSINALSISLGVILSVAAAIPLHFWIEAPILRALKRSMCSAD